MTKIYTLFNITDERAEALLRVSNAKEICVKYANDETTNGEAMHEIYANLKAACPTMDECAYIMAMSGVHIGKLPYKRLLAEITIGSEVIVITGQE